MAVLGLSRSGAPPDQILDPPLMWLSHFYFILQNYFPTEVKVPEKENATSGSPKASQDREATGQTFTNNSYDDLRAGDFDFVMDEGKRILHSSVL